MSANPIMRYFYRCAICKSGFWYDTTIENNNIECLHCYSSGHETVFDDEMKKVVPKLHRIQVGTNEKGEIELPAYKFNCLKCKNEYSVYTGMKDVDKVRCPECKAPRSEQNQQFTKAPFIISDISHQEGRTGHEDLDMSHVFGEGARISSRKQLTEYKQRTRDKYFANTDKQSRVLRPFKDHDTGKIHMELVTRKNEGIDIGEIHQVDETVKPSDNTKVEEKEWQELEKQATGQIEVAD